VRDAVQAVYTDGGDPTVMMSIPGVIRKFSEYLFTSSARVATLMSDQGKSTEQATALGSVNVFVTDFGTLKMVPNRLQQKHTDSGSTQVADVFILDPSYLSLSYLKGYRTEDLAKTGLAENKQMSVDWTLKVLTEKSMAIIGDINPATAVTL
jgi:nitrate reductase gamma subunit